LRPGLHRGDSARAPRCRDLPHADAVRAAAKSAALVHGLAHADAHLLAAGLDDVLTFRSGARSYRI